MTVTASVASIAEGCMSGMVMAQVMHMEPHEFCELEKVEATDDMGEASTSRPASGDPPLLFSALS